MIAPTFFLVSVVIGGSWASPLANNYIDNIMSYTLKNQLRMLNLEPAPIQNFNTEFKDKVVFVKVKGTANYTNGNITGLTNGVRYSECNGPSYSFGLTKVNCTIGFYQLQSHYNGKVKYGKLPTVPIKANANISTTTLFVDIVSRPGSTTGQIANMQFQYLGEVQPKFTGLGSSLNKHLKFLEDAYKTHVKAELMSLLTSRYHYALNQAVGQLPMPR